MGHLLDGNIVISGHIGLSFSERALDPEAHPTRDFLGNLKGL